MSMKVAIIAENQYRDVQLQLKYAQMQNEYTLSDIIIISLDGGDGLNDYLKSQNEVDYLICGYQDSYGDIINTIKNGFLTKNQGLVLINACSLLLPDAIANAERIIQGKEVAGGLLLHNYDIMEMTFEEAKAAAESAPEYLSEACAGKRSEGIIFSHEWLSACGEMDSLLMLPEHAIADYIYCGMKNGLKLYTTPTVGQYGIEENSNAYYCQYGPDCDRDVLLEKWGTTDIFSMLSPKVLRYIDEDKDATFSVLLDNCGIGNAFCQIKGAYKHAECYGIESNKKLSYVALGHEGVKRIYPNVERVEIPEGGYDYIIVGGDCKYNEHTRYLFKTYEKLLGKNGKLLFKARNAIGMPCLHKMVTSGSFENITEAFTLESIIMDTEMSGFMIAEIDADKISPSEEEKHFLQEARRLVNTVSEEMFWVDYYYIKAEKQPCHNMRSDEETLQLLMDGYSMARFGDGEYTLALEEHALTFQRMDKKLAARLREVIQNRDNDRLLVAIAENAGDLTRFRDYAADAMHAFTYTHREGLEMLIPRDKVYSDAYVTRFYAMHRDNLTDAAKKRAENLRQLWNERHVIFVEGAQTRLGIGNNFFDNAASIGRILAPATSSFDKYDEILEACLQMPEDALFLLAIGPCAGVLAYDLSKAGRQAIDIGHLDMEYMWYLAGKGRRVPVRNKYNNEISGGDHVLNENIPPSMYEQIIADFS